MLLFVLVWTDASIAIYSNQNVYRSEFLHRTLVLNAFTELKNATSLQIKH